MRRDIQALRAIAVTAVVVYHFWPSVVPAGFVGVDIFFVISGFLVGGHLIRRVAAGQSIGLTQFYARRVKRILPSAYLVILAVVAALFVVVPVNRWPGAAREGIASIIYLQNLLLARDSVDYLAQDSPESLFRHFWSLSVEEQFYIVTPLVLILLALIARVTRWNRTTLIACVLTTGAIASLWHSQTQVGAGDPSAYFTLTSRFWELCVGALIVLLPPMPPASRLRPVLAAAGWVGIGVAVVITDVHNFPGTGALLPVIATALVIYAGPWLPGGGLDRTLGARPVQYTGNISYTLYLTHWPILVLLPLLTSNITWVTRIVGLIAAVVGAVLLYHLVDQPLARIQVTASNARRVLLFGLGTSVLVAGCAWLPAYLAEQESTRHDAEINALLTEHIGEIGHHVYDSIGVAEYAVDSTVLVPQPALVRRDLPTGAEGRCKSNMADPFTPTCTFGDPDADVVIALAGDSHSEQYLPAFEEIAANQGVRVDTFFHSSCPLSTAQRLSDADRGGPCLTANAKTLDALMSGDYDLVVTSNRTAVPWVEGTDLPTPEQGFVDVWTRLTDAGLPVVVIGDNPLMLPSEGTTECLITHTDAPRRCARPRDDAAPVDYQREPATRVDGVTFIDTLNWFCDDTRCPAVIGNVVVYRDEQHISVLFAQTTAQDLWKHIDTALE